MSLPYFPMYPTDFEADTSHLTLVEDGAFNRLLRLCWMTPGCTLPDDEVWVMRRMRARTEEEKEAVRTVLAEFFVAQDGRLSNARMMREWTTANAAHEKRKNAGSKGGKAKALTTNKTAPSNATAKPKQPEPEPEPYTDTSVSDAGASERDFASVIFTNGVEYLKRHGTTERQARSVIGRWRKDHADADIFEAFSAASREGVVDPIPWITARLTPNPENTINIREILEAKNDRA